MFYRAILINMNKQIIEDQLKTKSLRVAATSLKVSYTNLRYWIRLHGIEIPKYTSDCANCKSSFSQRRGNPRKLCDTCFGKFTSIGNMNTKKSVRQSSLRRKAYVVRKLGGKCSICGYDKNTASLEFHHTHPENKEFMINAKTLSEKDFSKIERELNKCVLVCRNCHAETHHPVCSDWKDFPDYW